MSRAQGKHIPRGVEEHTTDPDSPEGRAIGMSIRTQGVPSAIPGGRPHLANPATVRHPVPIPAPQNEYRGILAHGVPPGSGTTMDRADNERGPHEVKPHDVRYLKPAVEIAPVPVYIVERGGGPDVILAAAPHSITMNANTGEPQRLCGRDKHRSRVLLLNEDASHNIRFAQRSSDLTSGAGGGGGALLVKGATSYTVIITQDELWAISADSGTPALSVIQEFEQPL